MDSWEGNEAAKVVWEVSVDILILLMQWNLRGMFDALKTSEHRWTKDKYIDPSDAF